jgi:hypothetical protein
MGYPIVEEDTLRAVFENSHPMPRAFVAHSWQFYEGLPPATGIQRSLTTKDPRFLDELRAIATTNPQTVVRPQEVQILSYRHDSIHLRCALQKPGALVITDSWSPDWTAEVDGKRVYIGKVDVAFRGIALAAGINDVILRYKPAGLGVSEALSATAFLSLGVALLVWLQKRKAGRKVAFPPAKQVSY